MFVAQISLLIVTIISLVSRILTLTQCKPPKKSTHTLALRHVSTCEVSSSSSSYATCWNVGACISHIAWEGHKWSGPHHTTPHHNIKMLHLVVFHSVTCYTNSIASCIHINTTNLRNITYTLIATSVILRSLESLSLSLAWLIFHRVFACPRPKALN
jgi:hypothetical protein